MSKLVTFKLMKQWRYNDTQFFWWIFIINVLFEEARLSLHNLGGLNLIDYNENQVYMTLSLKVEVPQLPYTMTYLYLVTTLVLCLDVGLPLVSGDLLFAPTPTSSWWLVAGARRGARTGRVGQVLWTTLSRVIRSWCGCSRHPSLIILVVRSGWQH